MAMNYVENLDLFGVPVKEIPSIKGSGAPTTSTEGAVGCFYMDTETGDMYKCVAVADDVYTWKHNGSSEAVLYEPQELTKEQQAQARENIGAASIDDIQVFTTTATKTGDVVTVVPVKDTTINVVTAIDDHYTTAWNMDRNSSVTYALQLHQINSQNIFDFVSYFGGPGPVENDKGSVVINDDGTVSVDIVDTTGSYFDILKNTNNAGDRYNSHVYPAGTYTLAPGLIIQGITSTTPWTNLGNKQGTFTVDVPFMVTGAFIADRNHTAPTTYQMWMVCGTTPPSDYTYSGSTYVSQFNEKVSAGTFDWQSGELKDSEGNVVQTVEGFEPFPVLDGPNTFLTFAGESTVSYQKQWSPDNSSAGSGSAESFDPTAYSLPILYLNGSTAGMTKYNAVTLDYIYEGKTGTATVKWQGSSSISYAKKNYTIKFDNAFEAVEGWGEQNKYCLKANYIDHSHARNLVNAKLWGQVVASRSIVPAELAAAPNYGAVDGFPIIVMLNDEFHGLYTFNIPKDGWMMGMGSGANECILCAGNACDANYFKAPAALTTDLEIEYITDEDSTDWAVTSANNLISACMNSDGSDLDTTIATMLDWQSAIDYYIFAVLINGHDTIGKNYIMATFNGTKWYFSAYDMDCTYGIYYKGDVFLPADHYPTFETAAARHRLFELIKMYKADEVKARYAQLRDTVMSESNIAVMFGNFAGKIPSPVYMQDAKKWPMITNTSTNNISQIRDYYRMRVALADKWIEAL